MQYVRLPRLQLIRLDAPEEEERLEAQFNPAELDIGLKAVYKDTVIPGMSHQLKGYSHTDSITLKFDLHFYVTAQTFGPDPRIGSFTLRDRERAEAFLFALCVPRGDAEFTRNRPASVMVVWPGFCTFEAVMLDVSFKYDSFDSLARPTHFVANCSMAEIRDLRYTSALAREQGWRRGDTAPSSGGL